MAKRNRSLKFQLMTRIIIPIFIGMVVSGTVASFIIYRNGPGWIQKVENSSYQIEGQNLFSLARSLGAVASNLFQRLANDLIFMDTVFQMIVNGNIEFSGIADGDPSYFINAEAFSKNYEDAFSQIPELNTTDMANITDIRTFYYIVGNPAQVGSLNLGPWSQVPGDYQTYFKEWLTMLPVFYSVFIKNSGGVYEIIYGCYDEPIGNALGIYMEFPAQAQPSVFVNYVSPNSGEPYYTFQTRPWYEQMTSSQTIPAPHTAQFILPYVFLTDSAPGYTGCVMVYENGTDHGILCMDYSISNLESFSTIANEKNAAYFILDGLTYEMMVSPNLENFVTGQHLNITQAIFNSTQQLSQEALNFNSEFLQFVQNYNPNTYIQYTVNGEGYLLTLYQFSVQISNSPGDTKEFLVGMSLAQSVVSNSYQSLQSSVVSEIFRQTGILIVLVVALVIASIFIVSLVANAITAPILFLTKTLYRLKGIEYEDDDGDTEKGKKKKSRTLTFLLKCIPKIEELSLEISDLHQNFMSIRNISQHFREAETAKTDAEAIISYSQALSICRTEEITRGLGTAAFNIGNIHFKHDRLDEAISNYKEATTMSQKEIDYLNQIEKEMKTSLSVITSVSKLMNRGKNNSGFNVDVYFRVKEVIEASHSRRVFQLAETLLIKAQRQRTRNFAENQHIRSLLYESLTLDDAAKRHPYRVIQCYLDVSETYLAAGLLNEAEKSIKNAETRLKEYEQEFFSDEDEDHIVPPCNLRQKCYYMKGKLALSRKKKQEACQHFTAALEYGEMYDPDVRLSSLMSLREIFKEQGLLDKAPNVQKILNTFTTKRKDVIMLMDYSQSMLEGKKLQFTILNLLRLFDRFVGEDDRVGFIRFNMNCDIVFTLCEKSKNASFLRKNIEDSIKPSGGTALYNAIAEALKLFTKVEERDTSKWIVALTDGDDNESRITYEQIYRKLVREGETNLIIVGLNLPVHVKKKLSMLCRATSDGLFLDSPGQEDLNIAFQALSNIVFGKGRRVRYEKLTI